MWTTIKFLMFASCLVVVFMVFSIAYTSSNINALENMNIGDLGKKTSGTVLILDSDYYATNGNDNVTLTILDHDFGFWMENHDEMDSDAWAKIGTDDITDIKFNVYCMMRYPVGSTSEATWLGQKFLSPGEAKMKAIPESLSHNTPIMVLMIPRSELQNIISDWGKYDIQIYIYNPQSSNASATAARGGATIEISAVDSYTWTERLNMIPGNIAKGFALVITAPFWLGAYAFTGGQFDVATFVDSISRIVTMDYPGVPVAIRMMVAFPIMFTSLFVIATVIGAMMGRSISL